MKPFVLQKRDAALQVNALAIYSRCCCSRPRRVEARCRSFEAASVSSTPESLTLGAIKPLKWLRRLGLLTLAISLLGGGATMAQTRSLPSHGKIKIDSYNYLLRDVHPSSQAQGNYLQNRLFTSGLKKAERQERWERLDTYDERQAIDLLEDFQGVAKRLAAGSPVSARSLGKFWKLVALYGDNDEIYRTLSSSVPTIAHEEFVATSRFIQILETNGDLTLPPLALVAEEALDAAPYRTAWSRLIAGLNSSGAVNAHDVACFRKEVNDYRAAAESLFGKGQPILGQIRAKDYLRSLSALSNAFYCPQHSQQIQQFVRKKGYAYDGNTVLGLIQHMLQNRITPAQGSTAQLVIAEAARPICRALETEIAVRSERIDSLGSGYGHQPYASDIAVTGGFTAPSKKVAYGM